MENKRRRQQKVRHIFFLQMLLKTNPTNSMATRCVINKIEDNQHWCQVKKMEMGRTYPTNGQEQQMLDGIELDA